MDELRQTIISAINSSNINTTQVDSDAFNPENFKRTVEGLVSAMDTGTKDVKGSFSGLNKSLKKETSSVDKIAEKNREILDKVRKLNQSVSRSMTRLDKKRAEAKSSVSSTIKISETSINKLAERIGVSVSGAMSSSVGTIEASLEKAIGKITVVASGSTKSETEETEYAKAKREREEGLKAARERRDLAILTAKDEREVREAQKRYEENAFVKRQKQEEEWAKKREQKEQRKKNIKSARLAFVGNVLSGVSTGIAQGKAQPVIDGVKSAVTGIVSALNPIAGKVAGGLFAVVQQLFDIYAAVDKKSSEYARSVGGGRYAKYSVKERATSIANAQKLVDSWNNNVYTTEELIERMMQASEAIGRSTEGFSDAQIKALADIKRFGISDKTISDFDTLGVNAEAMSKRMAGVYSTASKHGVNAKKAIDAVVNNLKMAQRYNFREGLDALTRMAERSVELKINMQEFGRFADKVSTVEGAVRAGAELSVLGGSFAQASNPMGLLYGGLNDVEELMKRVEIMTKGKAFFNREKGTIDIGTFERQVLMNAADKMGMDKQTLLDMAFNQERERIVTSQLRGGLDKDVISYIKNLATIDERGNAQIKIRGVEEPLDVRNLDNRYRDILKRESEEKSEITNANLGSILGSTKDISSKLDDILKTIREKIVRLLFRIIDDNNYEQSFYGLNDEEYKSFKKRVSSSKASTDEDKNRIANDIINERAVNRGGDRKTYFDEGSSQQGYAEGGPVKGNGTSTSDDIYARLSNGEYVIKASAAKKFRPYLDAINGEKEGSVRPSGSFKERYNITSVEPPVNQQNGANRGFGDIGKVSIDVTGTIDLKLDGKTKTVNAEDIFSSPKFIESLIKNIQYRMNGAYVKDNLPFKYGV